MFDYISHGPRSEEARSVYQLNDFETHERAEVQVFVRDQDHIMITVDAANGFVNKPYIALQLANGKRISSEKTEVIENESGKRSYVGHFYIDEHYVDALIEVRGMVTGSLVASAVEGFVLARYLEPGTYELFGPRGAAAVKVVVEDDVAPFQVWIGPAPVGILERAVNLTPVSAAFIVGSASDDYFTTSVNLAIAAKLSVPGPGGYSGEPDVAIYRWDIENEAWSRLDKSSDLEPTRSIVSVDIERSGIYALFIQERPLSKEDLQRENDDLRRCISDKEREIQYLRARLEQETQAKPPSQATFMQPVSQRPSLASIVLKENVNSW